MQLSGVGSPARQEKGRVHGQRVQMCLSQKPNTAQSTHNGHSLISSPSCPCHPTPRVSGSYTFVLPSPSFHTYLDFSFTIKKACSRTTSWSVYYPRYGASAHHNLCLTFSLVPGRDFPESTHSVLRLVKWTSLRWILLPRNCKKALCKGSLTTCLDTSFGAGWGWGSVLGP